MRKKKILVVDDEAFIRELVKDFLELVEIPCDEAENSGSALDLISENHYDLILLDWNLENCQAEHLVEKIRAKATMESTPIIVLTGDHQCNDADMQALGICEVIFKPFKVDEFLEIVGKHLEIR